jgi:threonyl-tRNA synthetase
VQVRFIPVSENHAEGAAKLNAELFDLGLRSDVDANNETLGNRVRKAVAEKIPYIVVVGDKELAGEDWMIRVRGQEKQEKMSQADFIARLADEVKNRK